MRSPLIAVIGSIVLVAAMGIWPAGAGSARSSVVDASAVLDPTTRLLDQVDPGDDDFAVPLPGAVGFYPYRRVGTGDIGYRWWNGKRFVGPIVDADAKEAYDWLVAQGVEPSTFRALARRFGGGVDGLLISVLVLTLAYASVEEPAARDPSPGPSSSPLIERTSVQLSPNYRFVWKFLGDTRGAFDGRLTGNSSHWHYEGTAIHSTPPRRAEKGGKATCDFKGDPMAEQEEDSPHEIRCRVTWTDDKDWIPERPATGFFEPRIVEGQMVDFEFYGNGVILSADGRKYDEYSVLLKPCEPLAAC